MKRQTILFAFLTYNIILPPYFFKENGYQETTLRLFFHYINQGVTLSKTTFTFNKFIDAIL
ncbi:hypothetical protein M23134_04210 [Microscilla marina ATCC 23134]|uniref:Uncharacterized protein n=1 Tax=Microscilla marina ATCC 23134 TaxID=313606 RepID=A1ZE68_MICM2|nr:hypothetical protein M23134_04210 [Microscilla marina ATCC 23134]